MPLPHRFGSVMEARPSSIATTADCSAILHGEYRRFAPPLGRPVFDYVDRRELLNGRDASLSLRGVSDAVKH